MLRDDVTSEGYRIRRIIDLPLVRSQHPVFALGWNIMHVIDDASPLRHETSRTLDDNEAVFILSLSGTDETTGQVLIARSEYEASAVRWNATFRDILEWDGSTLHIDYSKFHDVDPLAESPARSAPP